MREIKKLTPVRMEEDGTVFSYVKNTTLGVVCVDASPGRIKGLKCFICTMYFSSLCCKPLQGRAVARGLEIVGVSSRKTF